MEPIGHINTPYKQKLGIPRQGSLAKTTFGRVVLDPSKVGEGCLEGLEGFSHIWLIFSFHKHGDSKKAKVSPPRLGGDKMGVFATRSPHRPNSLGLSLCRLHEVDHHGLGLLVSEIDLLDRTPIYDIKPYIGYADRPLDFQEAWTGKDAPTQLEVKLSEKAQQDVLDHSVPEQTLAVARHSLGYDPRPTILKGVQDSFVTKIDQWNFRFRVDEAGVDIISIKP